MRRRNVKNASTRLAAQAGLVIFDPAQYKGKWQTLFTTPQPLFVEIGMGKGKFILENAIKHPEINFIGLEKYESVLVVASEKIAEYQLPNLKLICVDATNMEDYFEVGEIDQIYLNFSDPWPKNRHAKRRLTAPSFLERYQKILKPQGFIELKTDNSHLFEYSIMSFLANQWTICDFSVDYHSRPEEIITTEYEERFISLKQPIYYCKVKKDVR